MQQNPKRSRLAGFFLWSILPLLLSGCGQATPGSTEANRWWQLAAQAKQHGLIEKQAEYLAAAAKTDIQAIPAWLALQQSVAAGVSLKQQQLWLLQQQQFSLAERALWLAELGLWQQVAVVERNKLQQQWHIPAYTAGSCQLVLQPVLSTKADMQSWHQISQQWQADRFLSELPICFTASQFVDAAQLACSDEPAQRLSCQLEQLRPLFRQHQFSQIILLTGRGQANFNNGLIQLPAQASLKLFVHELSHLFGFLDEYPLLPQVAQVECKAGRITPNILFSLQDLDAYLARWQLQQQQVKLTKVGTCQQSNVQAYRPVSADSHLTHFELAVPPLYQQLIQRQLQQAATLMPVQYYFAYLARQQEDWAEWHTMMQQAAAWGYPPAKVAIANSAASVPQVKPSANTEKTSSTTPLAGPTVNPIAAQ